MNRRSDNPVTRRQVYYIPGYDPHPPRRYRELYRKEAAEQARISGYEIALSGLSNNPGNGWQVQGCFDGREVNTRFQVLVWSDLVRRSMDRGILSTYGALLRTAWVYLSSGVLRRLMWLRKGPVIAALYPIGVLILQALLALFVVVIMANVVGASVARQGGPEWVGWLVALPVGAVVLQWFRGQDHRIYAYYLMQDYAYSARLRGANPPELDARIAEFQATIEKALGEDVDEVLVVGHSSGVHIAIQALAALEREGRIPADSPVLGFLSLGQVVPMVSFLPDAAQLRTDLRDLSISERITWVDVSAPGDGCSFALCDPVSVSGVAPQGKRWSLILSAAFTQTLSAERWKALKRRYFRLHFQYLCAFDRPGDYDYFAITSGPVTLKKRYRDRAPSRSRIDRVASPSTSVVT